MKTTNRSAVKVMLGLIGLIRPLLLIMLIAIIMGCIGNLMAAFITILGGYALASSLGLYSDISLKAIFILIVIFAVLRGVLRYAEQASNHFIAFKLLARIRHMVFNALRRLSPAKLDGSEKGNLVSVITSDIELLEVFYAHTISPIAIAVITSVFMCVYLGSMHVLFGIMAAVLYTFTGVIIPVLNSKRGQEKGQKYRAAYGDLNTVVLDNLYGLDEIVQYRQQKNRLLIMSAFTDKLEKINHSLKRDEIRQRIETDSVILASGVIFSIISGYLISVDAVDFTQALVSIIAIISSFGPTAALSALSNNLNQTLASGNRVLSLLEEEPVTYDILDGADKCGENITVENVSFKYPGDKCDTDRISKVLENVSINFKENKIHGILGKSGCGKSTLLKLLMRFYETDKGSINYGKTNVNEINTAALRKKISYVTQETFLFQDTIENNIKVADENASIEEVIRAAKKASIHDFIISLPNGYNTKISELGSSLSGGERQRIGIARAFLHNSRIILLDEPTSNIDSLNEAVILKSLDNEKKGKTIVLVSHRKSTMGIADEVTAM